MNDEKYIELIKGKLKEKRFIHSLEVAKEARRLAEKYGADPKKAYTAGILHDVMKNAPPEEQLSVIEKAGFELTQDERDNQKLWHAIAGACYIKECGACEDGEIISAVRWHTTGKAGMTLLQKVVFVADFTSLDRDYDGAEIMREVSNESLEAAMFEGVRFTIADIIKKCAVVNINTLDVYNELASLDKIKNYKPKIKI